MNNFIEIVESEFSHPAIILWRAIEARYLQESIQKHDPQGLILDLGCAEGKIADILFKGRSLVGLDNCWDLLSHNNKKDTYQGLLLADGCKMPFANGVFQTIFSNCVIEHIPDLKNLLFEASRVLSSGGKFIFTVPSDKFGEYLFFTSIFNKLGLKSLAKKYSTTRNRLLNHFHCYDHHYWINQLRAYNLEVVDHQYYMPKKTTLFWDYLAALIFFFNKIKIFGNMENRLTRIFKNKLLKHYHSTGNDGAGLLIVAIKGD